MSQEGASLLLTKLHRPRVTGDMVARPRLAALLARGVSGPLTLVCAPAGFGKTTLVSSWIDEMATGHLTPSLPSAWLSLDENDSDLILFLRYMTAAIRTVFADACAMTLNLVHAPTPPPVEVILTTLSNELERLPRRFVLVLDDFNSIGSATVHSLLSNLLHHWPPSMHLVLISRSNPPLPLAILRAKGQITEIRSRDLRFTLEEADAFLAPKLPGPLSRSGVALLEERTEGWIAGLRLAALSLATADDAESAILALEGTDVDIAGYLVDEVLAHQPDPIQKFLLFTSILDRFCVALCEAIVGDRAFQCNVRQCMDWLENANLFVIPLDGGREWYRYHRLFQELLRQRLLAQVTPEQVIEMHCRAAEWLARRGLVNEALRHALAARDLDLAARLMESGLCDVLNREDRPTLERWLRLLPQEIIERRPGLLMIKAWMMQLSWQLEAQARVVQQVKTLIAEGCRDAMTPDELQTIRGQLCDLDGQAAFMRNEAGRAVASCREALSLLPPSWMYVRGGAMIYLGLSMQASGQGDEAVRLLHEQFESLSDKTTNYALRLLLSLCFVHLQDGQLEQVRQTAQWMLPHAIQGRMVIVQCWARYFLGMVHYQRNELAAAQQHFEAVVQSRDATQAVSVIGSFFGLVLSQQARGEHAEAWRTLELLSEFDLQSRGAETERTRAHRARLMLLQGDLEGASRWADACPEPPPDRPLLWLEEPHLTKVRILLARASSDDVQAALNTLNTLFEIAQRTCNTRFQVEILALRATALDRQGKTGAALTALQRAIELGRPGGFIRVFVDLGPRCHALLMRLAGQGVAVETVRRILTAFTATQGAVAARAPEPPSHAATSGPVEPLTGRELDVLALLRERLSNKEIAYQLHLSTLTVKRHTVNLYGKLGVNRRWDAVIKAESLGILPRR